MDNLIDLTLVDRAIGFAARAHEGQHRKTGNVPYIAHPVGVALILQQMGCDETVVVAGLLHDTVEDTGVTIAEIRTNFGNDVAEIVAGCTELPKRKHKWETRKLHTIEKLRNAPLNVKLVSAADKYHNLYHTLYTMQNVGQEIWQHFGRGAGEQAWYYRSMLESILANVDQPEKYRLFANLAELIERLFSGIRSIPPGEIE